jgi:hypothetical protein
MSTKVKLNLDSLKARREWKRHKVVDGSNFYRILPPFGEASNGYPYRKWQIIWGLQDPESQRPRPFASSMTSEKKCPITEYVLELKKKAEVLKSQLTAQGVDEETAKERLGALNKLISDLNPKTVYIYNAANKAGEVGLLEIKSTAQKKMKVEMASYIQDYNQDPTSLNSEETDSGVWFNITRAGMGRDTEYDVKKVTTKTKNAAGKISFEDDRSPLPDTVVENYDNLAYDLSSVYQVKTYEQLAEILEANMASIIELCPDADLSADTAVVAVAPKAAPAKAAPIAKAAGTKPVSLKIDDGDDEEEVPAKPTTRTATKAVADDDFLAQADALLNS